MELPQERYRLRITERAYKTAQTFARLIQEHVGPYECIGFLAGEAESDVIDTVILAPGQRVTATSVVIDGQSVLAVGREIEKLGKKARGWWHSHGCLPTFHSGVDDTNTRDVLAQIAPSNQTYLAAELILQATNGDGTLLFTDGHELIEISASDGETMEKLRDAQINVRRKVPLGMAYSLVVNARGDKPHAELHARRWCPTCQTAQVEKYVVPIEVVSTLNEAELVEEIRAKIRPAQRILAEDQQRVPSTTEPDWPQELPGLSTNFASWGCLISLLLEGPRALAGFLSQHLRRIRW